MSRRKQAKEYPLSRIQFYEVLRLCCQPIETRPVRAVPVNKTDARRKYFTEEEKREAKREYSRKYQRNIRRLNKASNALINGVLPKKKPARTNTTCACGGPLIGEFNVCDDWRCPKYRQPQPRVKVVK
jgi:hypothetical protein